MKLPYPWLTLALVGSAGFSGMLWYLGRVPLNPERGAIAGVHALPAPRPVEPRATQRFIGVLVSRASLDLTPRTEGRLKKLFVAVGQTVKAGDLIAQLDDEPMRKDLRLAQASLAASRAGASRALIQLDEAKDKKLRRLAVKDELSKEEVAGAESSVRIGGANVSAAQAAVAEQRARIDKLMESLGHTEIRAPFPGKISTTFVTVGSELTPQTPIVRIVQDESLRVRFAVPVTEVPRLASGTQVRLALEGSQVPLPGIVENVSPEVDPGSQLVYVEAGVELTAAASRELKPGLVVRVSYADTGPSDTRSAWQERPSK